MSFDILGNSFKSNQCHHRSFLLGFCQSKVGELLWHPFVPPQMILFLVNYLVPSLQHLRHILLTIGKYVLFQDLLFDFTVSNLSLDDLGTTVFFTVFLLILLFFEVALSFLNVLKLLTCPTFQVNST